MKLSQKDQSSNFGRGLLAGTLAGGSLGVLLGLLVASNQGQRWLQTLRARRPEAVDEPAFFDNQPPSPKEMVNYGKRQGEDLVRDARNQAEALLRDAERLLHEIKDKSSRLPNPPSEG